MKDTNSTDSPLEAAAGTVGPHVSEAFGLLADETRLAILLALWEEYDPHSDELVSFSRLFERVDYDDRGNFNYHLRQISDRFVRKGPGGGYELLDPGLKLVQVVVAGIEAGDEAFEPVEIDQPCQLCGAPTAVGYRGRHVYWECTGCSGIAPEGSEMEGFLGAVKLEPAGLVDRTPEEVKAASRVAVRHREGSFFDGLCPTCSGPVDARLDPCTDHDPNGVCEQCRRRFSTRAYFQCRVCKDHTSTSPLQLSLSHPRVVAFIENHGVSTRITAGDFESNRHVESLQSALLSEEPMKIRSQDPPRVTVTLSLNGDEISLTFDETVSVVDVRGCID
ncbi:MAG: hypothetical protein ABEJ05_09245 [Haloglomus sp.]